MRENMPFTSFRINSPIRRRGIIEEEEMAANLEELIKSIEGMTVLELSDLVKALEEKFGVKANMPMMAAPAAGAAGAAAPAAEEKSTFTVVLASAGANKISVIKEVRTMTSLITDI